VNILQQFVEGLLLLGKLHIGLVRIRFPRRIGLINRRLLERLRLEIDAFHFEYGRRARVEIEHLSRLKTGAIKKQTEQSVQGERSNQTDKKPVPLFRARPNWQRGDSAGRLCSHILNLTNPQCARIVKREDI
jgi:hypothetical protein